MPLGILPYRYKITAKQVDGAGTGWLLTAEVRDGANVLRDTRTVNVGQQQPLAEILAALEVQVQVVMEADAGNPGAFLDAVIAGQASKSWVSGDPAYVPDSITLNGVAVATWTNQPAALTALAGSTVQMDLSLATQCRLVGNVAVAGAAAAVLRVQYSTDAGANWFYLDGAAGPEIAIGSTGAKASAWLTLTAAARADVLVRVVGQNGNGAADPQFGLVFLQVR